MVQTISAPGAVGVQFPGASSGASAGALQAQLQKCQNQLADWTSCPSGKTPQGQAKIQQIENQTASIKAQLARIDTQQAQQSATAQTVTAPASAATSGVSMTATSAPGASTGGLINTYA